MVGPDPGRAAILVEGLREAGFTRVTLITDMAALARRIEEHDPGAVLLDLGAPSRALLEQMFQVARAVQRPVAVFVDRSDTAATRAAMAAGIGAYIVDGLAKGRLRPIVEMAVSRFEAAARLRRELDEARAALAERKVIDRAKGLLMTRRNIGEDEAYAALRQAAMNQNRRLAEVARSLLAAADLLD